MTKNETNTTSDIVEKLQNMSQERAEHFKAIEQIDLETSEIVKAVQAFTKVAPTRRKTNKTSANKQIVIDAIIAGHTTSTALNEAWTAAGKNGKVDNYLSDMVKSGQIIRTKVEGQKSVYSLAAPTAKEDKTVPQPETETVGA